MQFAYADVYTLKRCILYDEFDTYVFGPIGYFGIRILFNGQHNHINYFYSNRTKTINWPRQTKIKLIYA